MKSFAYTIGFCLIGAAANAACSDSTVDLRGDWGQARFTVELADDDQERSQGLMHRESLPTSSGMLFIYDYPRFSTFWMKNTLIPLDMIFADENGVVTHIHSNAIPHDETPIDGGGGVLAVLEINGGLAEKMGITIGSDLRHPSLTGDNLAWACE